MQQATTPRGMGNMVGPVAKRTPLGRTALLQEYTRVWQERSARAEAWDAAVKRLHARLQAIRSVLDEYVSQARK